MSRLSYTRVPVEVNLMSDLPYSIEVTLPNGSMIHQPILSISLTPASDLAGPRADKGKYVVVSGALGYSTSHSTELFGKIYRDGTLTLLGSSWVTSTLSNLKRINIMESLYPCMKLLISEPVALC
uniref:Uncharacterized protein n=1 Tax=Populus alba TaxID=43335 RepID=A0A4U5NR27_POPAL|nr:hypothetical protein D5086_0000250340 [Populus alba]